MKIFLPLPPIPIRKSPQESSIDIQEPLSGSISEEEESISSIEGCAIKIEKIAGSLASFNISETSQSMNATMKVKESQKNKTPIVKLSISSTFVEYSSELSKKSNDPIINMISSCYGFVCNTASIGGQERQVVTTVFVIAFDLDGVCYAFIVVFDPDGSGMVRIDLVLVWIHMRFLLCSINNTVLVFEILFGGDIEFLFVAEVLDEYGEIIRYEPQFHNDGETGRMITIFDPSGNRHSPLKSLINIQTS
ncbi:hypothetical protein QL285_094971 [Trifolium repens]|nr:hypothetical protein QL285_094971 [Trifolium repens]